MRELHVYDVSVWFETTFYIFYMLVYICGEPVYVLRRNVYCDCLWNDSILHIEHYNTYVGI